MNDTGVILRNVLALDSLYNYLTQYDRWQCHLAIRDKAETVNELSEKVQQAYKIVKSTGYDAPEFRYMPDRLLYYFDDNTKEWLKVTSYKPEIRNIIFKQLKTPK